MAGLNLDTFGEIMDKFLFENEVVLQVRLPENSEEAKVVDNVGAGATMQFYIVTKALAQVIGNMEKDFERIGGADMDKILDEILELVKRDVKNMREKVNKCN